MENFGNWWICECDTAEGVLLVNYDMGQLYQFEDRATAIRYRQSLIDNVPFTEHVDLMCMPIHRHHIGKI